MMSEEKRPFPSERFHRVLAFASDEADGLGLGTVNCQHLLYALSRESKGIARAVLESFGMNAHAIHDQLEADSMAHDRVSFGQLDLADEARDAIDRAVKAAVAWGHRILDTEHLLYGILMEPSSADELIHTFGINTDDLVERIFEIQSTAPPPAIRDGASHAFKFSLESSWLLGLAVDYARQRGEQSVSSYHLLLALLAYEGPVKELLQQSYGITEEMITGSLVDQTTSTSTIGRISLSAEVQKIFGYAIGEAWNRGHQSVAPVHIAMGMVRGERCPALDLLADFGADQASLIELLTRKLPPTVV